MPDRIRPLFFGQSWVFSQSWQLCATLSALLAIFGIINQSLFAVGDGPAPQTSVAPAAPQLTIGVRNTFLGYTFLHAGGVRYLVTEILLTNQSEQDLSIPISSISLVCDGVAFQPDIDHSKLTGYEFRADGQSFRFRDLPNANTLSVAEGETAAAWIVYSNLPKSPDIPRLELKLDVDGSRYSIDLNSHYDSLLALRVERIGPRGALGLLTIDGSLNSISVGRLVEAIDQLAARQVSRAVINFGTKAADVDESIANWLRERADGNPSNGNYQSFPMIVSTVREFHLAEIPTTGSSGRTSNEHLSDAAAVEAALATAYRGLPTGVIVEQIERGHRLAQASALVSGGSELPLQYLPLLLERAESTDLLLRRGALIALGGLGNPAAIDELVRGAQSQNQQTALIAIECLAASRYPTAHEQLKSLLDQPLSVSGIDLVRILARHPRSQWSEHLARIARDDQSKATVDARQESLRALGRIGHPDFTAILTDALQEVTVRDTAFQILLRQDDENSEQIAIDYALARLDAGPPTVEMLQLFDRVRDPRVPPRLVVFLDDEASDRSALINALARIGTAGIDDILADCYETLKPNEQSTMLTCLTQLRSSRLYALAESAMQSEHDGVFNSAGQSLRLLSDSESVEILANQLTKEEKDLRITSLANALEDIGTLQAVRALQVAQQSSQDKKRAIISQHLLAWRLKSPGGQHYERASSYVRQGEYEKAIEQYTLAIKHDAELTPAYSGRADCWQVLEDYKQAVSDYTLALERDPASPGAYSSRGHCQLKLEDYKQAAEDFQRAIEIDPNDGQAVTGLGIVWAIQGNVEKAIQVVNKANERFERDAIFAYNAACVYGRALESISKAPVPASEDQQKLRQEYADAATALLEQSLDLGFQDLDWMQADPDLTSLHEFEQFKKLLHPKLDANDASMPDPDETTVPQKNNSNPKESTLEP